MINMYLLCKETCLLFKYLILKWCWGHVCHCIYVEVRGQFHGVGFLSFTFKWVARITLRSPHVCSSKCFTHWSSQFPSLIYSVTAYVRSVLHRVCPASSEAEFPLAQCLAMIEISDSFEVGDES